MLIILDYVNKVNYNRHLDRGLFMDYNDLDFWHIRESLIGYIEKESTILELDDFSRNKFDGVFIGYRCMQYDGIFPQMFLSAILNFSNFGERKLENMTISAYWVTWHNTEYVKSHYNKLKIVKSKIEKALKFGILKFTEGATYKIGVERQEIDLSIVSKSQMEFRWLRENLEKLYWMVKIHESVGW